jgi:hypothetical protein
VNWGFGPDLKMKLKPKNHTSTGGFIKEEGGWFAVLYFAVPLVCFFALYDLDLDLKLAIIMFD